MLLRCCCCHQPPLLPGLPTAAAAAALQAVQLHKAGALAEAEAAYRRVLEQAPQHADALHQLGGLLVQAGTAGKVRATLLPHLLLQLHGSPTTNLLPPLPAARGGAAVGQGGGAAGAEQRALPAQPWHHPRRGAAMAGGS